MSGEEESVEQASAARQERLKALRAARELLSTPEGNRSDDTDANNHEQEEEEDSVNMKFRNYLPHDKELQEGKLAPPLLPKFEDPVVELPVVVEKKEDPFVNIAPKKPNWDLRRDAQKKIDKIEKRTQKAILQLIVQQEKEKLLAIEDGENDN
ncbi:coiled-coil domain-containing protein 12-like isoform X2 [Impatiens glandulifera]|uniref:coiled-coil domain-containing protein 12-like isoform X2 n=1 Tax=Impatiens glandulifera TaxID=253017 RepID=UPI001FB12F7E|nr:coiled-coil domain-containing protein 12-like isoform X2 [Impatiens glandulifera]